MDGYGAAGGVKITKEKTNYFMQASLILRSLMCIRVLARSRALKRRLNSSELKIFEVQLRE